MVGAEIRELYRMSALNVWRLCKGISNWGQEGGAEGGGGSWDHGPPLFWGPCLGGGRPAVNMPILSKPNVTLSN